MDNRSTIIKELRPSQARRRGFESHHPLHKARTIEVWLQMTSLASILDSNHNEIFQSPYLIAPLSI